MFAPRFWYKPRLTVPALLLWPLGMAYGAASWLKGHARARNPYYAGVPVISIGNLVVGGAGKTPVVQWLAGWLAAQGHQVAIVSRGYGGSLGDQPTQVNPRFHNATMVGDEPLLLASHFANRAVAVWIGRNRPAAVRRAEQAGATVILLDDAFQRRDVARNLDVLVLNGSEGAPWGNGLPMPAGPLREFLSARRRASFALVLNEHPAQPLPYYGVPAYRLNTVATEASIAPLRGKKLLAFAALAHPEKFIATLVQQRLHIKAAIAFPDHHLYTGANLNYLATRARDAGAQMVTTSKDAVKLPPGFAHVVHITLSGPGMADFLTEIRTIA
jgi:tetraacyldisaccharide 4'-kinase